MDADQRDGSITRLDAATSAVDAEIKPDVSGDGGDMTVGGGWVWARGQGYLLTRIDPQMNAIVGRYGAEFRAARKRLRARPRSKSAE